MSDWVPSPSQKYRPIRTPSYLQDRPHDIILTRGTWAIARLREQGGAILSIICGNASWTQRRTLKEALDLAETKILLYGEAYHADHYGIIPPVPPRLKLQDESAAPEAFQHALLRQDVTVTGTISTCSLEWTANYLEEE